MLSFVEYASEQRILELIIKERVKVALKGKLKGVSTDRIIKRAASGDTLSTKEQVFTLMPARNSWRRPRKQERTINNGAESKSHKQILTRSIAITIQQHRKQEIPPQYIKNLDAFISSLREDICSCEPITFNSTKVVGKKKKVDSEGIEILRPICVFESLREKLLIALTSKYLTEVFDGLLHEEILSYRPLRRYHGSETPILTDRDNAIQNIHAYRKVHRCGTLYVAECDIQKYFDTINHDVIRSCFRSFADKVKAIDANFEYSQVERIVDAYLNSYSFYRNVESKNEEIKVRKQQFEVPKAHLFIERGCYTAEEFEAAKSKIGIPQGGALSALMSNVILHTIDSESILIGADRNRFFCRYGDDILLMHTSKAECESLINKYCEVLTQHKLLYHDFVSVADKEFRKANGVGVRPILWDQKSRKPFLWGRSETEQEAVDWIGFLGYEMRYTGEVRLRRSSLDNKFKNVKRKYRSGAKTKFAKGCGSYSKERTSSLISKRIEAFVGDGFAGAKSLNKNKYSLTQALKLNSYTSKLIYRLLYKITRRNGLSSKELEQWWKEAKDRNCMNYIKTLPRASHKDQQL
jgi:hypothetical protein